MSKEKKIRLRYNSLILENIKGFDYFDLNIPLPVLEDDADIFVLGSKNGLGKTTILESCTLLFYGALIGEFPEFFNRSSESPIDFYDLLIRANKEKGKISGSIQIDQNVCNLSIDIYKHNKIELGGNFELLRKVINGISINELRHSSGVIEALIGMTSNPILLPGLMYFHSYRKIQEGNPELRMIIESGSRLRYENVFRRRYPDMAISHFKIVILQSLMNKANLFEGIKSHNSSTALDKLNELVITFADGRIEKLRPSSDNTIDFRITPLSGKGSFTFDGLSSGQKEIISTLFLIWYHSQTQPSIVLIDEPELHLNAEWHKDFVRQLHKLAPNNQYIISTHSEQVFDSVDKDRRILLFAEEAK